MRHQASVLFGILASADLPAQAQSTVCISAPSWLEIHGDGDAHWGAISRDGRFITFMSESPALVPGDTNNDESVFLFDRLSGQYEIVSVDSAGQQFVYVSGSAISDDGRFVAFYADGSGVAAGPYVRDRQSATTVCVNRRSDGTIIGSSAGNLARINMSATGRFVVFQSGANLIGDAAPAAQHIYVHDRDADADGVFDEIGGIGTTRISVSSTGAISDAESRSADISPDGRFVTFMSYGTNLVDGQIDTNGMPDIFIRDRDTDADGVFDEAGQVATERVTVTSGGAPADGPSAWWSSVSGDGRFVAFHSEAPQLNPRAAVNFVEVYVRDREASQTIRISAGADGGASPGHAGGPEITDDGRFIAYMMNHEQIGNGGAMIHDRLNRSSKPINHNFANVLTMISWANPAIATTPRLSADGRLCLLTTYGTLVEVSRPRSVYLRDRGPHYLADIDGAGAVNVSDLLAVISAWGACQPAPIPCAADLNGDGAVNVTDLLMIISNWG